MRQRRTQLHVQQETPLKCRQPKERSLWMRGNRVALTARRAWADRQGRTRRAKDGKVGFGLRNALAARRRSGRSEGRCCRVEERAADARDDAPDRRYEGRE